MDLKCEYKTIIPKWLTALVVLFSINTTEIIYANNFYVNNLTIINAFVEMPTGGSITMLETILRVNTSTDEDQILQISLIKLDNLAYLNLLGCKNNTCEYDVQQLPKGLYKVRVKTIQSFFEETIRIE